LAVALAVTGGAWAASGGLSGKQKQEVKKIAKSFQGKGPQGPAGSQGAAGSQGPAGLQGPKGDQGVNGKAGTFSTEPLPSEQTLTGIWGVGGAEGEPFAQISFPIPVSPATTAVLEFEPGANFGVLLKDGEDPFYPEGATTQDEVEEGWEGVCPGSAAEPKAVPGFLCIYQAASSGGGSGVYRPSTLFEAAHEFGELVPLKLNGVPGEALFVKGSWAVTAE